MTAAFTDEELGPCYECLGDKGEGPYERLGNTAIKIKCRYADQMVLVPIELESCNHCEHYIALK